MVGNVIKVVCDWFQWRKSRLRFNEERFENCEEGSDKGYVLEVILSVSKSYINYTSI